MKTPGQIARLAPLALLAPAAFAVHELRYLLAFGGGAAVELERTGHSYLHSVVPWLVLLLALVIGGFLRAIGRALSGSSSLPRHALSLTALWALCSAALVVIFACQELLEGLFATGHPTGLAGIFGYGGWWSIPAALCVGLVLAAVLLGARWALEEVARRYAPRLRRSRGRRPVQARYRDVIPMRPLPLAEGWSDRGPPR